MRSGPIVEVTCGWSFPDQRARDAGQLCGVTGTADAIDASVVLCARARGHRIVTSDPEDADVGVQQQDHQNARSRFWSGG